MGGGTLRVAAKAAGIGCAARGRGFLETLSHPPTCAEGQSFRVQSGPVIPSGIVASQNGNAPAAAVQAPASGHPEKDEWEFVEGDVRDKMTAPLHRVVFGNVPSYKEAEDAAAELKEAIESGYPLKPTWGTESANGDASVTTAMPGNAVQAFTMLIRDPGVEKVVASIATDPEVWESVLKNKALTDYIQSLSTGTGAEFINSENKNEPSEEGDHRPSGWKLLPKVCEKFFDSSNRFESLETGIKDIVQNVKLSVEDMVASVSSYLHVIFGAPESGRKDASGAASRPGYLESTLGASFMGLAVMVVMIVLFKRV